MESWCVNHLSAALVWFIHDSEQREGVYIQSSQTASNYFLEDTGQTEKGEERENARECHF